MSKFLILTTLLVLAMIMGCGDDTTSPGKIPFTVNLNVTDPEGLPVAGLEAKLHVFIPDWLVPSAAKPMTIIPFSVAVTSEVSMVVYDMEGNVVNELFNESKDPGSYHVALAVDGAGNPLVGTHLYRCEMVASVEGVEQFRGETFMTLYTSIDRDQRPVMGVTNAQGEITYGKRTEFPYLYNPGPQMSIDENAQPQGTFEFINKVEITLTDPGQGLSLTREVVIGQGRNTVNLVWAPQVARKPRDKAERFSAKEGVTSTTMIPPPDAKYSVGPGYPNPFN